MIPRMHHLVRQRVLHLLPPLEHIGTELDAVAGIKPALHPLVRLTPPTPDVAAVELPAQLRNITGQVADDGRVLQEMVALRFAAAAVEGFVAEVSVAPVG